MLKQATPRLSTNSNLAHVNGLEMSKSNHAQPERWQV
jgi:hypothetical protein